MKNPFTSPSSMDRQSFIVLSFIYGIVFLENMALIILRMYHHLSGYGPGLFTCLWCIVCWIIAYVRFNKWKRMQMIEELIEKNAA
jgi:hypothetical protein